MSREENEAFFRRMLGDVEEPTLPFGLEDVRGGDGEVGGSGWEPPVPERTDEPAPVAEPADEEKTTEFEPPANADDERRE